MSALLLVIALASAQEEGGFDAHGFHMAPQYGDVLDPLSVWRPGQPGGHAVSVQGLFEYADSTLVSVVEDWNGVRSEPLLDDVFGLNLGVAWSPHERVGVQLAVPLFFTSRNLDGGQGVGMGDLRLAVPVTLLVPEKTKGFGLALIPMLDLPTGAVNKFLGNGGVGGGGTLALGYSHERFSVDGNVGFLQNPTTVIENLQRGSQIVAGLGAGVRALDWLGVRLEANLAKDLKTGEIAAADLPVEGLLSLRGKHKPGLFWTVGGGAGFTRGAGASAFRLFAGIGYSTGQMGPADTDGDGILNRVDACVREPEVVNAYADDDGCPDALSDLSVRVLDPEGRQVTGALVVLDAKELATDSAGSVRVDGLMPGVALEGTASAEGFTAVDLSTGPLEQGLNEREVRLGWLPGTLDVKVRSNTGQPLAGTVRLQGPEEAPALALDSNGFARTRVAPGAWTLLATAEGYVDGESDIVIPDTPTRSLVEIVLDPPKAEVRGDEIVLLEPVYFAFDEDVVLAQSMPVLEEVAKILREHPEITKVEVQGHTDAIDSDAYNRALSQRRVDYVRSWLIGQGIAASRLVAKGYGESQPIATNDTEEGRAKNRRVMFMVVGRE
jgi:OOP family OmpA-OmpF porin